MYIQTTSKWLIHAQRTSTVAGYLNRSFKPTTSSTKPGTMPLPPKATKPLVLVFPCALTSNYQRCLVIAQHLRLYFDIRFLQSDQHAHLVYQQGFETFIGNFFPFLQSITSEKVPEGHAENLELTFLEQVEILETLQPAIVIGDGIDTLSMAAEFTGIPLISVLNGYHSPYFANRNLFHDQFKNHEPYSRIREKYGLRVKHTFQEELEGELNWICDLPELFPQRELPYHYELIGPLIEVPKSPRAMGIEKLSSFKKTVLLDLDDTMPASWIEVLDSIVYTGRNLIVRATDANRTLLQKNKVSNGAFTADLFSNADLLVCNSEALVYKALLYGLPIIFKRQNACQQRIIEALEHWQIGTSWDQATSSVRNTFDYWINNKLSDAHRTLQYQLKTALNSLENKLLNSISLHFPCLEKAAVAITK